MRDREACFILMGDPVAKARARMRYGFGKRFYDLQHADKIAQRMEIEHQMLGDKFIGPCHADFIFYMPIKRTTKYKENDPMFYKPDTDNMIKWICDVMESVVYDNDCILSEIYSRKIYGNTPRTEITIRELPYVEKNPQRIRRQILSTLQIK